jgi:ribosome recycling factor
MWGNCAQERRKTLAKGVSKMGEEGKVAIRNIRRDAMKMVSKMQKDSTISEDEARGLEKSIQELTDDYVKQVDKLVKSKEAELLQL